MVSVLNSDPAQDLEVRQTAQRLLADHLHRPSLTSHEDARRIKASSEETFWPGISIDLSGATLVDLNSMANNTRRHSALCGLPRISRLIPT